MAASQDRNSRSAAGMRRSGHRDGWLHLPGFSLVPMPNRGFQDFVGTHHEGRHCHKKAIADGAKRLQPLGAVVLISETYYSP